jgi:hypothetical protein
VLATTHIEKYCDPPPYACPSATRAPSTWCAPALPMTCSAASANRSSPDAPIGLEESTPPDGLTGSRPPMAVVPDSVSCHPVPGSANPRFSSHIGSNHEKGTYISATSTSLNGSVMPAARHSAAAASTPARGFTGSFPANIVGSVRIAVARIHATGPGARAAASASPMTTAQAPSEDGQVSS